MGVRISPGVPSTNKEIIMIKNTMNSISADCIEEKYSGLLHNKLFNMLDDHDEFMYEFFITKKEDIIVGLYPNSSYLPEDNRSQRIFIISLKQDSKVCDTNDLNTSSWEEVPQMG
jgi:hypothetical protein